MRILLPALLTGIATPVSEDISHSYQIVPVFLLSLPSACSIRGMQKTFALNRRAFGMEAEMKMPGETLGVLARISF